MNWPNVVNEYDTIRAVLTGKSLARLGDGELKHINKRQSHKNPKPGRQEFNSALTTELRWLLVEPAENCLVGIPTMDKAGPKYLTTWVKHYDNFLAKLSPTIQYYSAFISRPDSAPWIYTREYAELMVSVWRDKRVVVISEPENSLLILAKTTARETIHIGCPRPDAYTQIANLQHETLLANPEVVLMAVGPTATVLANRLSQYGIQALDLGSSGGFVLSLLAGAREHQQEADSCDCRVCVPAETLELT